MNIKNSLNSYMFKWLENFLEDYTFNRLRCYKQVYSHHLLGTDTHTTIRGTAPETTLKYHVWGLGDEMMAQQFVAAFSEYLRRFGDPELGAIDLLAGGFMPLKPVSFDGTTLYWWYSFGPMDYKPDQFLSEFFQPNMATEPELILCGSKRIQREAQQAGYATLYFPIGTYGYEPLGMSRSGLGYAGSKSHKDATEVQTLMGPFIDRPEFEWVDDLGSIAELNLWYNAKLLTFGLTKPGQQEWGVVNSRVFETLATGTPLIHFEHPTLDDVLGFEYPYQVPRDKTPTAMVESIMREPDATLDEFGDYSEKVREEHSYLKRFETLVEALR